MTWAVDVDVQVQGHSWNQILFQYNLFLSTVAVEDSKFHSNQ